MKTQALLNKNKYSFLCFAVLLMLSFIYDGFSNITISICKVVLSAVVSIFFSSFLNEEKKILPLCAFSLLTVISCNAIFLTEDIHILLSITCFFCAMFFESKCKVLTPVFSGLCVIVQPLTLLFFVPSIIISLIAKKEKLLAIITAAASAVSFVLTKFLAQSEFYIDQFSSYYLSLHLVYFSNEHLEIFSQFLICSIPLLAVALIYLIRLFLNGKKLESIFIFVSILISVFAFALSKNTTTVIMILIPIFALMLALYGENGFKETADTIGDFFQKHLLLFLLLTAWVASYPLTFGTYPYGSELFSKSTYVIFRQE